MKFSIKKRRDDIRMTYVFHNFVLQFPNTRSKARSVHPTKNESGGNHRRELIRQHIPSFRFFVSARFTSQSWTTVESQRLFDWISMVAPRTGVCRASMLRNNETWYGRIDLAGNRNHGREKIDSSRYARISLRWKRGELSWRNKAKSPPINDDDEI